MLRKKILMYHLVCKGLVVLLVLLVLLVVVPSNDDVGVARGTVFQQIRTGVGFKTGDFVEEKLGGLQTVDRLWVNVVTIKVDCAGSSPPRVHT